MTGGPPHDSPRARLLGVVLAGGEGRRFGRPKAGATLAGVPMVARAVDVLRAVTEDVVVSASSSVPDVGVPVVADRVSGAGPLAGLEATLLEAEARGLEGALVLACDLPLVEPELLRQLVREAGGALAAAPAREGGGVEPMCALYRVDVREAVTRRLSSQDRSLQALFRDVGGRAIPWERLRAEPDILLNVNTPADGQRAEMVLEARRRP
ncbi:MAG: molybdenum cofactor guanylyltransferase [Gemmatimonadetes bacterium]|nr:molybdenum cofactor guanylyltransferase [Gemmatimonadota bacterium]